MYTEITAPIRLLNEKGHLEQPGWAKEMYWQYNREAIPQELHKRLKEWDYYLVTNPDYGVSWTFVTGAGFSFLTIMLMDYKNKKYYANTARADEGIIPPADMEGNLEFAAGNIKAKCIRTKDTHTLTVEYPNFENGKTLTGTMELILPKTDKMVIATPFDEGEEQFYYNAKVNCMPANGEVTFGDFKVDFAAGKNWGVVDYGRGIWPKENVWYWGSASGEVEGVPFGFNIGYGFGNLSSATENMIFYNGITHKFDKIVFNIPSDSFLKPWTIVSNDGRFEMSFSPALDRWSDTVSNGFGSIQHQVFGTFTGKAVLDNGEIIQLKEFWGFAEEVKNFWP